MYEVDAVGITLFECSPELTSTAPLHSAVAGLADAVQEVASVDDQVKVALSPFTMEVGLTEIIAFGATGVTDRSFESLALPPGPLQVSVYVRLPVELGVTLCEPLVNLVPLQAPLAVHAVA